LESKIEGLVEGVFNRAFSSKLQPIELARKLAKEMDSHKTASVSQVYVPNEYTVYLSPADHEEIGGYERALAQELSAYLLDHARRSDLSLLTRPQVDFDIDERLRLGEFGIQARLVKPPARQDEVPSQGEAGQTRVYSAVRDKPKRKRGAANEVRAVVMLEDKRYVLDGPKATIGRSSDCDCVVRDPNVSRRHAELRRRANGDWYVVDQESTNGVKVNGRKVESARLAPGDEVSLGTVSFVFEIE
jgi:hypothetical protein